MNQTIYDQWRQKRFNSVNMQRILFHQLQDRQYKTNLFRFYYIYEYGARCEFNKEFQQLYLKHFNEYQMSKKEKTTMILFTKQIHSLNTLLTQK